jgi:hypothetical protein
MWDVQIRSKSGIPGSPEAATKIINAVLGHYPLPQGKRTLISE